MAVKKFLVGSSLLNLSNPKDTDYVVIVDTEEELETLKNSGNKEFGDNHYLTKSMLVQNLNFEYSEYRSLINYQYDATINPAFGSYYEYHILDYKDTLKTLLKKIAKVKSNNLNKRVMTENGCCTKLVYHIAYNTFILINNSPIITNDQKAIIQSIHDKNMPIDYIDDLILLIDNL